MDVLAGTSQPLKQLHILTVALLLDYSSPPSPFPSSLADNSPFP